MRSLSRKITNKIVKGKSGKLFAIKVKPLKDKMGNSRWWMMYYKADAEDVWYNPKDKHFYVIFKC